MTQEKSILIKTLSAFSSFCEENHLTYYAAYGTALGAVRHHGFIPWDDDIDVHMPRSDYRRLLELRDKIPTPYQLADISKRGYTAPFIKFMDMSTTIWEFERIPYMLGVYIDIFPLDECPEDVAKERRLKKRLDDAFFAYFRSLEKWSTKELIWCLVHRDWKNSECVLKKKYHNFFKQKSYHHQVVRLLNELSSCPTGSLYVSSADVYIDDAIFKKEWFGTPVDMPFENITIKVPEDCDGYLRFLYGDYMQLPPKEDQVTHHSRYFVSLDKGLSVEEVRNIMRTKNG